MTAYENALRWLYGLESRGIRLGLERMHQALALRAHPERFPTFVHVAGTNGKGSVTALIEATLREAGVRTGMFTSPHLHRFTERIRIDGRAIAEAKVVEWVEQWRNLNDTPPLTLFEVSTLMAFEAFRSARCELVVLEVGLGGRLDATNVVDSAVSVITTIGRDHEHILGEGLTTIAREKAGIIRPSTPVVVGVRSMEALQAIEARAAELDADIYRIDRDFGAGRCDGGWDLRALGDRLIVPALNLAGGHQGDNAACAFATIALLRKRGWPISDEAIRSAFATVSWPGRGELISGRPRFILDCAHNPDGCDALAAHIGSLSEPQKSLLIFGALGDKAHEAMLSAFDPVVAERIFVSPRVPRAIDPKHFATLRQGLVAASIDEAIELARERVPRDGLVVIAGSIFLIAEARARLLDVPTDPPTWP